MSLPLQPRRTKAGDLIRILDAGTRRATVTRASNMRMSVTTEGTSMRSKGKASDETGGSTSIVPRWG